MTSYRRHPVNSLLWLLILTAHAFTFHGSVSQDTQSTNCLTAVTTGAICFEVGSFHPPAGEREVCRPIRSQIHRDSPRYIDELVMSTNPLVDFQFLDSRIMSSRLKLCLDRLANSYYESTWQRISVIKAWTVYPDPELLGDDNSLHYEGEEI